MFLVKIIKSFKVIDNKIYTLTHYQNDDSGNKDRDDDDEELTRDAVVLWVVVVRQSGI